MPTIGPLEILVILVVGILVLPPDKLPEAARQIGKTFGAIRRFQSTITKDFEQLIAHDDGPAERDPTPTLPPKTGPTADRATPDNDTAGESTVDDLDEEQPSSDRRESPRGPDVA